MGEKRQKLETTSDSTVGSDQKTGESTSVKEEQKEVRRSARNVGK